MSEVGSPCESLWSHMQSRVGSCSELSCLRSEDILSIASFITSELINPGVSCTSLFSLIQTAWRYMWKQCCNSQDFRLYCSLGHPSPSALSIDPACKPLMELTGCSFLSYVSYHTCHCQVVQSQKHHCRNLGLVSIQQYYLCLASVLNLQLYLLKCMWTLVIFITQIGTP